LAGKKGKTKNTWGYRRRGGKLAKKKKAFSTPEACRIGGVFAEWNSEQKKAKYRISAKQKKGKKGSERGN